MIPLDRDGDVLSVSPLHDRSFEIYIHSLIMSANMADDYQYGKEHEAEAVGRIEAPSDYADAAGLGETLVSSYGQPVLSV